MHIIIVIIITYLPRVHSVLKSVGRVLDFGDTLSVRTKVLCASSLQNYSYTVPLLGPNCTVLQPPTGAPWLCRL